MKKKNYFKNDVFCSL